MKKILALSVLATLSLTTTVSARESVHFEADLNGYSQWVPYKKCWKGTLDGLVKKSLNDVAADIEKEGTSTGPLRDKYSVSQEDVSALKKELVKLNKRKDRVNEMIKLTINSWNKLDLGVTDLFPDALMFFVGGKADLPKAGGVSAMGAIILMPFCVNRVSYDGKQKLGKKGFWELEWKRAYVAWVGKSRGGWFSNWGVGLRAGFGGLWSIGQDFTHPKQFQGLFGGRTFSGSVTPWGIGLPSFMSANIKVGYVQPFSFTLHNFLLASASLDFGANFGKGWKWDGHAILPIEKWQQIIRNWSQGKENQDLDFIKERLDQLELNQKN